MQSAFALATTRRQFLEVDTLDPHDDGRADAAEKAVGLANFARKHGAAFGRIELIRSVNGRIQRLRLRQESAPLPMSGIPGGGCCRRERRH